MSLFDELIKTLPELTLQDFAAESGTILLQDNSDGAGPYIAKWEYELPIPDGYKLGK
jgi:hypothetical protein